MEVVNADTDDLLAEISSLSDQLALAIRNQTEGMCPYRIRTARENCFRAFQLCDDTPEGMDKLIETLIKEVRGILVELGLDPKN